MKWRILEMTNGNSLNLTARQREVLDMYNAVMSQTEIAKELGCSKQNISIILKTIENNERKSKEAHKKPARKRSRRGSQKGGRAGRKLAENAYLKYADADLSILSKREKEILLKKIEGRTHGEIADELRISTSAVGVLLKRAVDKLNGRSTYEQKNKERINARRRTPEHREKAKVWHKNYVASHPDFKDRLRDYNRRYYIENRDRILERQKNRDARTDPSGTDVM